MPTPDPGAEWTGQVGSTWAREWRRTDRSFGALTSHLLDPAATANFGAALDIGCGAGELACTLAQRVSAAGIHGIDISAELLAVARARCTALPNIGFEEADAACWTAADGFRPDLLISRHGVMFFADPVAAFTSLREQAAPGARLRFSCFRSRQDNRWFTELTAILPQPQPAPDPIAPGPFAFADAKRVEAILAAAGWREISFESFEYAMIAGEGVAAEEEAIEYFQRIGPVARAMRDLTESDRAVALDRLATVVGAHHDGNRISLPAAAWIVSAEAPLTQGGL